MLKDRCVPSVVNQAYEYSIEHIIISDRNPLLPILHPVVWFNDDARRARFIRTEKINESWRNPITESGASIGAIPWYIGSLLALGTYVGFLGDDDEYLPDHVARHVATLEETGADFSVSQVDFRVNGDPYLVIGDDSFALGHLDSDGIMCRVSALAVANWSAAPNEAGPCDWRLVQDWIAGGLKGVMVPGGPTAIHHDGWAAGKTGRPDRGTS